MRAHPFSRQVVERSGMEERLDPLYLPFEGDPEARLGCASRTQPLLFLEPAVTSRCRRGSALEVWEKEPMARNRQKCRHRACLMRWGSPRLARESPARDWRCRGAQNDGNP